MGKEKLQLALAPSCQTDAVEEPSPAKSVGHLHTALCAAAPGLDGVGVGVGLQGGRVMSTHLS